MRKQHRAVMVVLFDLDGVLIDSRGPIGSAMGAALADAGHPVPDEAALHRFIGPPLHLGFAQVTGLADDDPRVDALVARYREIYPPVALRTTVVMPGVVAALEALAAREVRMAVATSKGRDYAVPIVEAVGLGGFFAAFSAPELSTRNEPKAVTIARALDLLGADPEDAVMVGDRSYDMAGALANGVRPVGVTWGIGSREELLAAGAELVLDDPAELARL